MSDRENFEEAAARLGYNLTMAEHETGEYHYPVTQDAWLIWQESQEQAARAQGGQGEEPVAWLATSKNSGWICAPTKEMAISEADSYWWTPDSIVPLYTQPAQPQGDGWIKCSDRLPTEADGYVWIYFPKVGVSDLVWRWHDNIGEDGETHWMPTGLKRPQPPKQEQPK